MTRARTDATAGGSRAVRARAALLLRVALGLCAAAAAPAARAAPPADPTRWVSASLLAGIAQPVAAMADYQWDVRPHAAWGAQALAGRGPWAAGLRLWRSSTTQGLGLSGVPDPGVSTTSLELLGRARVARWRALECTGLASGGRLAIRYHPDQLTVATGGGPVEVALDPVSDWVAGAGVGLRAPLAGGWTVGMEAERRWFSLDAAHRSGSSVALTRERFGDWQAHAELSRAWSW